ncbi:MAG: hypothetical protein KDB00_12855, partial [Planctomycetales bacterium]|nr:hypothetical protein [Planctomycetales bacterium]
MSVSKLRVTSLPALLALLWIGQQTESAPPAGTEQPTIARSKPHEAHGGPVSGEQGHPHLSRPLL